MLLWELLLANIRFVRVMNNIQYQYSDRDARAEKSAYFLKQILIDCVSVTVVNWFLQRAAATKNASHKPPVRKNVHALM